MTDKPTLKEAVVATLDEALAGIDTRNLDFYAVATKLLRVIDDYEDTI